MQQNCDSVAAVTTKIVLIYTAIPYRESTGFLQGIPCVVFPPLHALALFRVWENPVNKTGKKMFI